MLIGAESRGKRKKYLEGESMSRSVAKVLVLTMLVSVLAGNVMSQSKIDDPFRFALGVSLDATDNRDSTTAKESNIDYYISPKFELLTEPGEASKMSLSYSPSYRHRTEPALDQNDSELYHAANIDFRQKSSEIHETRVIDKFSYTDDPSVTQGGTQFRRDSSYMYNYLEIGMHRRVQSVNTVDVYGMYSLKAYDDATVAKQSDEDRFALHALYLRQYQRQSALAFELEVGGTGYEQVGEADRTFTTAIGQLGLEHIATPSLRMGARVGAQYVDYKDADLGSEVSPTLNLSISGSTIPTVTFSGTLNHRIRESDVFPYSSQEATDLRASADWTLKEMNIVFNGAVGYHVGTYSQDQLPVGGVTTADGDETSTVIEGGVRYKHNNNTEFSAQIRTEDVSPDDGIAFSRDFTRNSLALSILRQF